MDDVIYFCTFISLVTTWVSTRTWIRKALELDIVGFDMNKLGKTKVPEMGGICVIFGFFLGFLFYIGFQTFYLGTSVPESIFAAFSTVLMVSIIGIMDDISGWKKGLKQWHKPLFTLFAALPMMVINAGYTTMSLPIFGVIDFGNLYPLLIIPIGIVGASNSFNMIAGFNGLEAGMGIIILSALGYVAFITDRSNVMMLSICMIGALVAFLYFNWCPAKIFPGNTMTYSVGALMACITIIGDMEKIAILLFIPYAIDFFLQLRGRFKEEAFARVNKDGSLEKSCKGLYHMTDVVIAVLRRTKQKVFEKDVVIFTCGIEAVLAILVLLIYTRYMSV